MGKTFKKILCSLLVVIMCLTSAPLQGFVGMEWPSLPEINFGEIKLPEIDFSEWFSNKANATNEEFEYTILNGSYIEITKYNGDSKQVTIPSEIDDYIVQKISGSVFKNNKKIETVIMPDSIENLGGSVFENCTSLENVVFSNNLVDISGSCFKGCTSLEAISFPFGVKSIGGSSFADCTNLTEINFSNSITTIGNSSFANCTKLKSVNFTDSIIEFGDAAFYGCSNLEEVRLPIGLKTIGTRAFMNCTSLTEVDIPDSVTNIGYRAFYGDVNLEKVKLPRSWSGVGGYDSYPTYYGEIFTNCNKITEIVLPDGLAAIPGHAFFGCTNLTKVTIPDSVTKIGNNAFEGCVNLTSINIADSVTTIDNHAFSNCDGLTIIDLPDNLKSIGAYAFNDCDNIAEFKLPDTIEGIGYRAFVSCDKLSKVNYPMAWKDCLGYDSYPTLYGETFKDSPLLTTIVIPEGVTTIPGHAFYGCTNLKSIILPSTLTTIGNYAFYNCDGLTNIDLPEGLNSIGYFAFSSCDNIEEFKIPDSVTTIGYKAFADCNKLSKANYPAGWNKHIGYDSYPTYYGSIFADCIKLRTIEVPEGVTSIVSYAFNGCKYFKTISLPLSLKSIGSYAFQGCEGLISQIVYEGTNNIDDNAFGGCINLETIWIPDTVSSIGTDVFINCPKLTVECSANTAIAVYCINNNIPIHLLDSEIVDESELLLDQNKSYYIANTVGAFANGYVTINLAYKFKENLFASINSPNLIIRVPSTSSLLEKTLTIDGKLVTDYEYSENLLSIDLTKEEGNVSFCLRPDADGVVATYALVRYTDSKTTKDEMIGIINENIPMLSIQCESETNKTKISVKGVGPTNSNVELYVDDELITTVHTNMAGSYAAVVNLKNPENYSTYTIKAKATSVLGEILTATTDVKYYADAPSVKNIIMEYNGNSYDLTTLGNIKPTVIFEPGNILISALFFNSISISGCNLQRNTHCISIC